MTDIPESKPNDEEMPLDVVSLEPPSGMNEAASIVLTGNESGPEAIVPATSGEQMEKQATEPLETVALPTAAAPCSHFDRPRISFRHSRTRSPHPDRGENREEEYDCAFRPR